MPKKFIFILALSLALIASSAGGAAAHQLEPFQPGLSLSRPPAASAGTTWEDFNGNFETGDFSQYLEVQAAEGRATIVKSPVGEGAYAARFERRVGDELIAGSNRSEAVPDREFSAGETLYFRHLLYLPFESIDWNHFLILCQWHDSSAGPPPLALQTFEKDGVKKLLIGSGTQKSIYYEFDIPGNAQWFELVYRITFGAQGSIEVWLNGESLGEVIDIDTLGTEPTNWKLGSYRSGEAEGTTVVFQDGVMITKSFFSDPPGEPPDDPPDPPKEPPGDVGQPPLTSPPAPLPTSNPHEPAKSPNALPCQLAKRELRKALVRLRAARHRHGSSRAQAQRRRSARRISQDAKRYQQAKLNVQHVCQGGLA